MRLSRSLIPDAEGNRLRRRRSPPTGLCYVQDWSGRLRPASTPGLPAGLRVLRNIGQIVREEQDAIGCQEVLMPTVQPADLWRQSGRYDAYGPEMLRIK